MGVRGLTTHIAKNEDRYLNPFELHDCDLVIDGDSLSCQLYKSTNSAFGGDYDHFFRTICNFFGLLKQCNVTPYVLLDGGYQPKKLRTVTQRLRSKVGAIKHLNPYNCQATFPIMMRDVFVEAMEHCGVHFMRCLFEADDEVAALSRKLKCPVLSSDSDFYIHNVTYIPSTTLTLKVFRRNIATEDKKVRQRKKLVSEIGLDGEFSTFKSASVPDESTTGQKSCYYYIQCSVYRIANLAREENLKAEMLPLFAILLGNDYISRSIFTKFFLNVSMKKTGKNCTQQGKRIVALLRWLKHETLASAIDKIINHVEKDRKQWLREQINIGIAGYVHEKSVAHKYFMSNKHLSLDAETLEVPNTEAVPEDEYEDGNKSNSEDCDDEDNDDDDDDEDENNSEEEEENSQSEAEEIVNDSESDTETKHLDFNRMNIATFIPPEWLLNKILSGKIPRYIVDLMTLRLYINAPQVENFELPDCNRISIPILRLVFTILHYPQLKEFRYLTRVTRRTDIEYKRFESLPLTAITPFDPEQAENFDFFKLVLSDFEDSEAIFQAIDETAPPELRLFFIAIIFWSRSSTHFNVVHASSLILCYIVLSVIDSKVDPVRHRPKFEKMFASKVVKKIELIELGENVDDRPSIGECEANVTRDECILGQLNFLDLFLLSEKIRKKHTEFSSDVIHGFGEFQAIVHQINCLNVLCGERYPNINASKCINGCFLYNTYMILKDRPNINYYIRKFLLPNSPNLYALFESMVAVITPFIGCLLKESISKKKKKRNIIKKRSREQKKGAQEESLEEISIQKATNDMIAEQSDSEFEDLNNKFSCLLKM